MKKKFIAFIFILLSSLIYSQTEISQLVIPKKLFVGDKGEIRYSFKSKMELLKSSNMLEEVELDLAKLPFDRENNEYTIERAILQKNGGYYTVVIRFIPWKVGYIQVHSFDLLECLGRDNTVKLMVEPKVFEVSSITTENSTLRPVEPPLLLPGSIYIVYLFIIILILIAFLIIKALLNWYKIINILRNLYNNALYFHNQKRALRSLRRLEKRSDKFSDIEFCEKYQKLIRTYLEKKFKNSFFSCSSKELYNRIVDCYDEFSARRNDEISRLQNFFYKCDIVRFSCGVISFDFNKNERLNIINSSKDIICSLELGEKTNA